MIVFNHQTDNSKNPKPATCGQETMMMTTTKLSKPMLDLMNEMLRRPVRQYGRLAQIKALAKRGMARQKYGEWILTDAAITLLEADKNAVAIAYATYFLRNGNQIRHNMLMVDSRFNNDEFYLRREYFKRGFQEEVDAVAEFQQRAIELARAEIRAGIAS